MKPGPLSNRQAAILDFIRTHQRVEGYPPTIREIAARFGHASPRAVQKHLSALQSKGHISRRRGKSRAIDPRMPQAGSRDPQTKGLPILGRVPAGPPGLAAEEVIGHLSVDPGLCADPDAFALRVAGDSMIDSGIFDGDYAVIRPQCGAENGEVVVARLGDEVTVKRFYREKGRIRLQPENRNLSPILIEAPADEFVIIGKVVAIVRKL